MDGQNLSLVYGYIKFGKFERGKKGIQERGQLGQEIMSQFRGGKGYKVLKGRKEVGFVKVEVLCYINLVAEDKI